MVDNVDGLSLFPNYQDQNFENLQKQNPTSGQ